MFLSSCFKIPTNSNRARDFSFSGLLLFLFFRAKANFAQSETRSNEDSTDDKRSAGGIYPSEAKFKTVKRKRSNKSKVINLITTKLISLQVGITMPTKFIVGLVKPTYWLFLVHFYGHSSFPRLLGEGQDEGRQWSLFILLVCIVFSVSHSQLWRQWSLLIQLKLPSPSGRGSG